MKEDCRSVVAALSVNMLTVNMLLSVFFLPGVLAGCDGKSPHLSITAPKKLEALNGSCLRIPCSFTTDQRTFNSSGTIYGVWIKSDSAFGEKIHNIIFNSSKSENRYQMNITGNLSQKNCTTLFFHLNTNQTDKYFFRIENGLFRATASCDPVKITIKDSAWRPTINISGVLKEKKSVTVTCSAFTPCPHSPPELTWNLQQHSHRQIEENTDGTFTSKIQETIILSDSHDGYNINCSVTYPVNGGERVKSAQTEVTLSVSYAPKDTSASISPSGLVSAGSWVNLSCSSRAKPPVSSFTWFQSSKGGAVRVAEGRFYRLNVTEMTDTGSYYCVAENVHGNHTSSWNNLQDEGSFPLSTAVITGIIFIVLICLVIYAWCYKARYSNLQQTQNHLDMETLGQISNNQTEDLQYEEMSFFKRRPEPSDVSVQDSRQQQETVDTQVKGSEAEYSSEHTPDGQEDPCAQSHTSEEPALQIQANKTEEELHYEEMNCFKKRPEPSQEESELGNSSAQTENLEGVYSQAGLMVISKSENRYQMNITGNLSQKNCTTLFSNLNTSQTEKYFFRIENGLFRATASCDPVNITNKDSAWSPTINISGVLEEKKSVNITCSASTPCPCPHSPPELTWNLQQHSHRQIEENTDGTFTSKIQETITLSDSHDGYNISCSVQPQVASLSSLHEDQKNQNNYQMNVSSGKRVKSAQTEVTLSVSYAPKDTSVSISPSGLVSAGSWVNLSCSSRAKPPVSSFTWFQSSKGGAVRVAEGHFYSFNATERGEYYCVASNNLGNQTSQRISLDIKGRQMRLIPQHNSCRIEQVKMWLLKRLTEKLKTTKKRKRASIMERLNSQSRHSLNHSRTTDWSWIQCMHKLKSLSHQNAQQILGSQMICMLK
ncbi:uncharacterized protein ACNS7B_023375 [Menidia menidia]